MKGRKIGSTEVTLDELEIIAEMTGKATRPEIARKLNRSTSTVWHYQKQLNLI